MAGANRSALAAPGRISLRESRQEAGRDGPHGLQITSFKQAAVWLAGGFARAINDKNLRATIQLSLSNPR